MRLVNSAVKLDCTVDPSLKLVLVLNLTVFDGDDCASNPCKGDGTCVDGFFNFTCTCPNGTLGVTCQCTLNRSIITLIVFVPFATYLPPANEVGLHPSESAFRGSTCRGVCLGRGGGG